MEVIGITAPKGTGKTTYAIKEAKEDGGLVLSYATPIKDYLINNRKLTNLPLLYKVKLEFIRLRFNMVKDYRNKEGVRKYYQKVGDICRSYNEDYFIEIMMHKNVVCDKMGVKKVYIDDVRYLNEANLCDRVIRLHRDGIEYTNEHSSENEIDGIDVEIIEI